MRFPEIDYETHPAYLPYRGAVSYDDVFLQQQIDLADQAYAEFCASAHPGFEQAEDSLSRIRAVLERVALHVRQQNIPVLAEEWLRSCMSWTLADIGYETARRVFSAREYQSKPLRAALAAQLSALRNEGMYITALPDDSYDEIRRLALELREELRARAIKDPFNRAVIAVRFNSPLWKAIKRSVSNAGVLDVLSEFKANRMTMLGAGLEYSHPKQQWYQSLYSDVGLADGPFQYLHVDEGYCLPKAMIYVTPVTEDSGPTRAVPGSNRWESSEIRLRMFRALDRVVGDRYDQFNTGGNYRAQARRPELRRIFMQLPRAFRGSSHFGDDILPNTSIAGVLDSLEVPYLSERAGALVFDGPHLLHRGSLVRHGERMALQIGFRNRSEARIKSHQSHETFLSEELALGRKYARKFVMSYL